MSETADSDKSSSDNDRELNNDTPSNKCGCRKADIEPDSDSPDLKRSKQDEELEYLDLEMMEIDSAAEEDCVILKYEGNYECTVIKQTQLMAEMEKQIKEVKNILMELSDKTIRQLLNHFKWDKEKLLDKFYEVEEEVLLKSIGILSMTSTTEAAPIVDVLVNEDCDICCTKMIYTESYGLAACGHVYCIDCWGHYLSTQILENGMCESITCAAPKCSMILEESAILTLVRNDNAIERYRQLLTKSFLEANRLMKHCASPDCSNAIQVKTLQNKPVTCSCGSSFCFGCGEIWHGPLKCMMLKKWKKKCDDDSETAHWISAHTKDCPKCHAAIEKNGGCNHMTCRNVNCRFEFCWICLGDWKAHGDSYSCNAYNAALSPEKETCRKALERYLFYCSRYMNHLNSGKLEKRLYKVAEDKSKELHTELNMTYYDTQFLKESIQILASCRQTLQMTYAFAFYLEKTLPAVIFEGNQSDLEKAVEALSHYLEREMHNAEGNTIKPKLLNLSKYCEKRRLVLLQHVYEGYDEDVWTYNNN